MKATLCGLFGNGRYPELKAEVEGMAKASTTKSKGKIPKATPKSKADKGQ